MGPHEDKIRRLLNDFGRVLLEAIDASSAASGTVRRIRQEGYSLFLVMDSEDGEEPTRIEITARPHELPPAPARRALPPASVSPPLALPPGGPTFRLSPEDVSYLRSIGIDATRSPRRRRGAS